MDFKEQLGVLIDAMLAGKDDESKAAFHAYTVARTSALVAEGEMPKGFVPFKKKEDKCDCKDGETCAKCEKEEKEEQDDEKKSKKSEKDDEKKSEKDDEKKDDKKDKE